MEMLCTTNFGARMTLAAPYAALPSKFGLCLEKARLTRVALKRAVTFLFA